MITDSLGGLARKSAVPIVRIEPITDLDFIRAVEVLMKETAISDKLVVAAKNDRKLRRQTSLVPREECLQYGLRLLARVLGRAKSA